MLCVEVCCGFSEFHTSFLFGADQYSVAGYTAVYLFLHLTEEYLDCIQVLKIMNKVAINIYVQVSV